MILANKCWWLCRSIDRSKKKKRFNAFFFLLLLVRPAASVNHIFTLYLFSSFLFFSFLLFSIFKKWTEYSIYQMRDLATSTFEKKTPSFQNDKSHFDRLQAKKKKAISIHFACWDFNYTPVIGCHSGQRLKWQWSLKVFFFFFDGRHLTAMDQTKQPTKIAPEFLTYAEKHALFDLFQVNGNLRVWLSRYSILAMYFIIIDRSTSWSNRASDWFLEKRFRWLVDLFLIFVFFVLLTFLHSPKDYYSRSTGIRSSYTCENITEKSQCRDRWTRRTSTRNTK